LKDKYFRDLCEIPFLEDINKMRMGLGNNELTQAKSNKKPSFHHNRTNSTKFEKENLFDFSTFEKKDHFYYIIKVISCQK
jgi:hypothetical protein